MRTFLLTFSAIMLILSASPVKIAAQQSADVQKEVDLLKKTDKKMQYSLNKCTKEMKALSQKMDENIKNLNIQAATLKTSIDTLDNHLNSFKAEFTKSQDQLISKVKTLSIRLWLCALVLLIIAAYIFFGVIGAIKKNRITVEARMLNDKEAFELAIKKIEKEMNDKLRLLEQQLVGLKK